MSSVDVFVPIALMKIEGQLGHGNAIESAKLELEVMKLRYGNDGIPPEKVKEFFQQYIDTRKGIDDYVQKNVDGVMSVVNADAPKPESEDLDDVISKMNDEKEVEHEK